MAEKKQFTVKEFVDKYNAIHNEQTKMKMIESLNIKKYIPFAAKNAVAKGLMLKIPMNEGVPISDTPARCLSFAISVCSLYTDLILDANNNAADYDLLMSSGVLNEIINYIGSDYEEYLNIYNSVWADLVTNSTNTKIYISNQISKVGTLCNEGLLALAQKIEKIDMDKFAKTVDKFSPIISKFTKG